MPILPPPALHDDAKERVVVAAVNWRTADRVSIATGEHEDKRATYKLMNSMREAIDRLNRKVSES